VGEAHLVCVDPVPDNRLVQVRERERRWDSQPEIEVLCGCERRAIAAGGVEGVAPHGHRRVHERSRVGERAADGFVVQRIRHFCELPSGGVDEEHGAADYAEPRVLQQPRHLRLEPARERRVVCVEPGDERSLRERDASVQRGRIAAVRRMDDPDPRIRGRVRVEDRGRVVGRAVVDDDQLPGVERLAEDAVDRLPQVRGPVAHGRDHGDERSCRLRHREHRRAIIGWDV
jgi:hypothetical protein